MNKVAQMLRMRFLLTMTAFTIEACSPEAKRQPAPTSSGCLPCRMGNCERNTVYTFCGACASLQQFTVI